MSEPDIFREMDAAAAAMVAPDRDDLQIEFRQIVRARYGDDLLPDEWLDLFETWLERHLGSIRKQHAEAAARINAFIEESAGTLPPGDPFTCPCGEVIYSWSPDVERLHGEHIYLAQFDRPGGGPLETPDARCRPFGAHRAVTGAAANRRRVCSRCALARP